MCANIKKIIEVWKYWVQGSDQSCITQFPDLEIFSTICSTFSVLGNSITSSVWGDSLQMSTSS
jgi:hypothetical protein